MEHADLVGAIDRLSPTPWAGTAFRHIAVGRAPLSGEGARIVGGRWNPRQSFPVLYMGLSKLAVISEFHRLARRQHLAPESFLPRSFHTYAVDLRELLDLRNVSARVHVGLADADLTADALGPCQAVGEAAYACGREGIIVPGATGNGDVLAVFIARLGPESSVNDVAEELWETVPSPGSTARSQER
jgi:RES domain-containing protein